MNGPKTIRVGVIAGLTGDYAQVFQNWVNGITLAHELYQSRNLEPRVELLIENDEFNSSKGLSAYHKLNDVGHVDALLNGSSATIGAIAPLVRKQPFPVLQLGEETEEPMDDNILQVMPGNLELERALGRHLSTLYPDGVAVFYTVHATMIRFLNAFKEGYAHAVTEVEIDPSVKDVQSLIPKAVSSHPSCIVILAFPPQGAMLVKQIMRSPAAKIPIAFDANFQSGINEYREILGDLAFLNPSVVATLRSSTSEEFASLYKERFHSAPGTMADLGFDAFNLLMANYDRQASEWTAKLKSARYKGASGPIEFDLAGIRKPEFEITTVEKLSARTAAH